MDLRILFFVIAFVAVSHANLDPNKILCPVLAAMYNAGDLRTDETGRIQVFELKEALKRIGTGEEFAEFQAIGVAAYSKSDVNETHRDRCFQVFSKCWWEKVWKGNVSESSDRYLNIFTMNGHSFVEHAFSTGVRGGATNVPSDMCGGVFPCQKRFDTFVKPFANPQGRFYRQDLERMICYAKKFGDRGGEFSYSSTRFAREWQMHLAVDGWLSAFGWTDPSNGQLFLTLDDARAMLMEGVYPTGWQKRDWGCLFSGCAPPSRPAMTVANELLNCEIPGEDWWTGTECETVLEERCTLAIGYCNAGNSTCIGDGGVRGYCTCKEGYCARVNPNTGAKYCEKRNVECTYFGQPCAHLRG